VSVMGFETLMSMLKGRLTFLFTLYKRIFGHQNSFLVIFSH
jgi:hypothetical protein